MRRPGRGFSLLEVLVSLAVLLTGIVAIVNLFPLTIKSWGENALLSKAILLADRKVEEIRRDDGFGGIVIIERIRALRSPTPPRAFPEDPRFTYSFNGVSLIDSADDPDDPRDDPGVARVIVRFNRQFDPSEKVVYELRFGE